MVAASVSTAGIPEGSLRSRSTTAGDSAWIQELLESADRPVASSAVSVLQGERQRCRAALAGRPLPSRREEAWRFTDLRLLTEVEPGLLPPPPARGPAESAPGLSPDGTTFSLILDGENDPLEGVVLPEGLEPIPPSELEERLGRALTATGCEGDWPTLLNGALCRNVLALRVTAEVDALLEVSSDAGRSRGVLPLRILLVLEEDARLDLLQIHRASGSSLTSVVIEGHLGTGARLSHSLVSRGTDAAALLVHLALTQDPRSEFLHTCAGLGWGFARYEPRLLQTDGQASTVLRGLQLVQHHQLADTHSHVEFAGPEGTLDQLHKAVADQEGRSVFNGAVRVPRKAQRTNAVQMSRNLLLSTRARIDTKPELEIVADDVRCAHGATVSRLEQEELFYLRSRGVAGDQAARLLLRGFCEEVLASLHPRATDSLPLREWLTSLEPGR